MSIASSVHSMDLFGDDPFTIPFKDRVSLLNNMMEKFFVISEGQVYHMKVESDAEPVNLWMAEKEKEAILKNPKDKQAQEYDAIMTAQRAAAITDAPDDYPGKKFSRIANIEGIAHQVDMLFITKNEGKTGKSAGRHPKKFSTYGKSKEEVLQTQIEQYLEEQCEWGEIHFQITDQNQEVVTSLYDNKKLAQMLAKDEYLDWASALSRVNPLLLGYIQQSLVVDKAKGDVSLHNSDNQEINVVNKFRKFIGGKYLYRCDVDITQSEKKMICKHLLVNTEVELCEFLYDIKIYQIQKLKDRDIIAYQIEIFTLNDPDVIYQYTYPMNFSAET